LKEKSYSKTDKRPFLKQKINYFDILLVSETQSTSPFAETQSGGRDPVRRLVRFPAILISTSIAWLARVRNLDARNKYSSPGLESYTSASWSLAGWLCYLDRCDRVAGRS